MACSTEIMQQKLCLMRSFLEKQDPMSREVDDVVLKRFLRHRKLDVDKATDAFLKYLKWRKSFVPNGSVSESEIQNQISHKKFFMQGFDKKGRPIVVLHHGKNVPTNGEEGLEELKRFMVYSLDKICARMSSNGQEQLTFIGDFKGWTLLSNCDMKATLMMFPILKEYYPEIIGKIYLINQPFTFRTIWKILNPFIRGNTKKKFVSVDNMQVTSRLLQDIDKDQLPEIYGGKLPLVRIEVS